MSVVLAREVSVGIVHVLTSVDIEILLLAVSDLEWIVLDAMRVLSEESTHNWVVVHAAVAHESALGGQGDTVSGKDSPTEGHTSDSWDSDSSFNSSPGTNEPRDTVVSNISVVHMGESGSILI